MLIEVRAKNCYAFTEEIRFSMKADMRNKKFRTNVHSEKAFHVLKVAGIYGQNNAGKTCLIKCIVAMRNALMNSGTSVVPNLFSKNPLCELGVTFMESEREFTYDFRYDAASKEYLYESFAEITVDKHGNEKKVYWLKKDAQKESYECLDEDLQKMIPVVSKSNLLFYVIDTTKFAKLDEMKRILVNFASSIDVLSMDNIPIQHTIDLLKNRNQLQHKIVSFVKNADLYMDNFEYIDDSQLHLSRVDGQGKPDEKALDIPENIMDMIRLTSTYRGVRVPSLIYDSTGTKKIAALAGYAIEALEQGRILVIDEMDSSIHFKLTRAIAAMFNNELNCNAQLIFTVHDINLMDCQRLFRKEQIWFVDKDEQGVYVYSLADFTSRDGVRDTTDIIEKYKKGALGALPEPELIETLLDIRRSAEKRDADGE